jgi:hypothetical protein
MATSERAVALVRAIANSGALRAAPALMDTRRWRGPRPAAVRIERSHVRSEGDVVADQTALTLWFGDGPDLPGMSASARGRNQASRLAVRTLVGFGAAVAIGAAGAIVARQEASRIEGARAVLLPEPGKNSRA